LDSALVTFAHSVAAAATAAGVAVDTGGLPEGARKLVALSLAVKPSEKAGAPEDDALTARVGRIALHTWGTVVDAVTFVGEASLAFLTLLRGQAPSGGWT
jgi:phospholipid/cholesterol/gamma-HCH transport system permease protein